MTAMVDLPEYMQICYDAMHKFVNEIVGDVSKDHGLNTFPMLSGGKLILEFFETWTGERIQKIS